MAKITLGDIFIGTFPMTQGWGARPEVYKQWGQAGHNGWDFVMPNGTLVISPADGVCLGAYEERDANGNFSGFGRYCKILHNQGGQNFVTVYAHLQSVEVSKGQQVKKFQLISKSDNNGFSEAPHLHFGIYLSDAQGNKSETNTFGGYHDPGDKTLIEWVIENPTKPYEPTITETMGITPDAKTALDLLTTFQTDNKLGNLEGAMRALIGSFTDLQTLQKDTAEIRKQLDEVKTELRDRDTFISGQKETVGTLQKQQIELADMLAVANDYPTIKGEILKLIGVEDDNTVLKSQLASLKDDQGNLMGKAVADVNAKNKDLQKQIDTLVEENTVLKSKRNLDKYTNWEKIKLGVSTFLGTIGSFPKNTAKKILSIFKRGGGKK